MLQLLPALKVPPQLLFSRKSAALGPVIVTPVMVCTELLALVTVTVRDALVVPKD